MEHEHKGETLSGSSSSTLVPANQPSLASSSGGLVPAASSAPASLGRASWAVSKSTALNQTVFGGTQKISYVLGKNQKVTVDVGTGMKVRLGGPTFTKGQDAGGIDSLIKLLNANQPNSYNRGHLLAKRFGGKNLRENISPLTYKDNDPKHVAVEDAVNAEANQGFEVDYFIDIKSQGLQGPDLTDKSKPTFKYTYKWDINWEAHGWDKSNKPEVKKTGQETLENK